MLTERGQRGSVRPVDWTAGTARGASSRTFVMIHQIPRAWATMLCRAYSRTDRVVLWFGTLNSGLDRYDPATGRFTHFRHDPSNPRSLSNDRIYALLEDRKGDLWIGTYEGGLNRFDRKTGTFTAYTHNDSVPGSLSAPGVWALHEDRDGVLWVGSYKGGLNRFNPETETFTHFKEAPSNPQGLSNSSILCIHEDRKGHLWLATMNGLNRFDKETGTFRKYFEKDGLPNSYIVGILEDDKGNLWMSTVKGISRFDPQNESFRNFDQSDGLQGDDFNQGAFARDDRTGEMYFGGNNGFNVFHPDSVRENALSPPGGLQFIHALQHRRQGGRADRRNGIAVRPAHNALHTKTTSPTSSSLR